MDILLFRRKDSDTTDDSVQTSSSDSYWKRCTALLSASVSPQKPKASKTTCLSEQQRKSVINRVLIHR